MIIIKRISVFLVIISLPLLLSVYGFAEDENEIITVTGVDLSHTDKILDIGESFELSATVYPFNAADRRVWWYNSNPEVVEVVGAGWNVEIVSRSKGESTISVFTVDGGKVKRCRVEVRVPVHSISIDQKDITLEPGKTIELEARVLPTNANQQEIIWESSRPGVANVDEKGTVEALHTGEARIIARSVEDEMINTYITVTVADELDEVQIPITETPVEEPPPDDGNNLWTYLIIGVGAIVILGGAFFVITSKKKTETPGQSIPPASGTEQIHRPVLVGLSGTYAGQRIEFINNQVTIGRDSNVAQVAYPQANTEVSRKHCIVYYDQASQQIILEDTSTNGTFLANGEKLERNQRHTLQPGESFSLTDSGETFTVELE